jgi:hypothetical protein
MTEGLPPGVERDIVTMEAPGVTRAGAGGYPLQGFYTRPAGTMPKVALIAAHYNVDFAEHYLSALMAQRGYGFLGWNTRFRGADHFFALDRALVDIGQGVAWLRAHGAETVVLLGNSGGGSLMAAYHAQCQDDVITSSFGISLLPEVHRLLPGDLYVSLAAHPGRPEVLTGWLDPSVTDETDPTSVDPELDMYADGREPPFDEEFVRRYRAGRPACPTGSSCSRAPGPTCASWTPRWTRPSARSRTATGATRSGPTAASPASARSTPCAAGSACGAWRPRRPAASCT